MVKKYEMTSDYDGDIVEYQISHGRWYKTSGIDPILRAAIIVAKWIDDEPGDRPLYEEACEAAQRILDATKEIHDKPEATE